MMAGAPVGNAPDGSGIDAASRRESRAMNSVIYIVGLIVVVIAILSFFGLR